MAAKSGKAVKAINPIDPEEAFEADEAKPSDAAKVKAKQVETKTGKYGKQKVPAFKPGKSDAEGKDENKKSDQKSWIEIELLDEEKNPVAGEKYEIELPDGKMAKGTLDNKGCARVEGFEAGNCKVSFPKLDKESWSK